MSPIENVEPARTVPSSEESSEGGESAVDHPRAVNPRADRSRQLFGVQLEVNLIQAK